MLLALSLCLCVSVVGVDSPAAALHNRAMEKAAAAPQQGDPFAAGAVVVVTLTAPREKFWGVLLMVTTSTASVAGVDLNSFDDFVRTLRAGEPASANIIMFPLHRVERIELDQASGSLPSLRQRFEAATGRDITHVLGVLSAPTGRRPQ